MRPSTRVRHLILISLQILLAALAITSALRYGTESLGSILSLNGILIAELVKSIRNLNATIGRRREDRRR